MKKINLTSRQREIIIGKILGDGHLETHSQGQTYKLRIEHSYNQKDYVDWVYNELKSCASNLPKIKFQTVRGKIYRKYWFNTISTPSLRFYGQQFYPNNKKVIPKYIYKWLSPLTLAVWFMDDGSIKSKECQAKILNTQGYSSEDVQKLIDTLEHVYNLHTKARKQKEGLQIYIPAQEVEKFKSIIEKYIIPSMEYKLVNTRHKM